MQQMSMSAKGTIPDLGSIQSPVILKGSKEIAYRDPAAHYCDGVFRLFHTQALLEDGYLILHTAVTESTDLVRWSEPRILTPRNREWNYSSPGNVVRYGNEWVMCLQSYPIAERGQAWGDQRARIYKMTSKDLIHWNEPELLPVKGPDVPVEEMGRMIDPYFVQDVSDPNKWWCFYKQDGASISYTYDFRRWTYFGRVEAGENACVISNGEEYVLMHSPQNGIGLKKSSDLVHWTDLGITTLGQEQWIWAQGRLTAGFVLDMREHPRIGRYLLFFHGSTAVDLPETHGAASLGLAWSYDLLKWEWPGEAKAGARREPI